MGYYSSINGSIQLTRKADEVKAPSESFIAEAERLGINLDVSKNLVSNELLPILEDLEISYFFQIDPIQGLLIFGESAKAYDFKEQLIELWELLSNEGFLLSGEISVEGEEQGDVSVYIFTHKEDHRTGSQLEIKVAEVRMVTEEIL